MAKIFLRHCPEATFSERLHLALGPKRLAGRPVTIPARAADLAAYCPLRMLRPRVGAQAETPAPLATVAGWHDRASAIGHGLPQERAAAAGADPSGLSVGQEVSVPADEVNIHFSTRRLRCRAGVRRQEN